MKHWLLLLALPSVLCACIPVYYPASDWYPISLDQSQPIPDPDLVLKQDDSVRVLLKDSRNTRAFSVAELTHTGFIGIGDDNKRYRVEYAKAEIIWVKRFGWHHGEIDLQPQNIRVPYP